MQEKESIMVVWCKLKVPSLKITVRHHSASLAMLNSYRRDRIFNQFYFFSEFEQMHIKMFQKLRGSDSLVLFF